MATDDFDNEQSEGGAPSFKLISLLILAIALCFFFFQNGNDVPVNFLMFDATVPLWAIIGISVAVGAILDRLGSWQWRRSRRNK